MNFHPLCPSHLRLRNNLFTDEKPVFNQIVGLKDSWGKKKKTTTEAPKPQAKKVPISYVFILPHEITFFTSGASGGLSLLNAYILKTLGLVIIFTHIHPDFN